ncbi:MAG: hypothetical protein ABI624_09010 [Casimicrobiaceae bacterium]
MTWIKVLARPMVTVAAAGKIMFLRNALQRKAVTAIALGGWLFAYSVGVVHACGLDEALGHAHEEVTVAASNQGHGDDDALAVCAQFCADDVPVLSKVQPGQDQPGAHALPLPCLNEPLLVRIAALPSPLRRPHPPPGIALNTCFVRLAL